MCSLSPMHSRLLKVCLEADMPNFLRQSIEKQNLLLLITKAAEFSEDLHHNKKVCKNGLEVLSNT